MQVKDIMTQKPVYGTPDTSLHVIAQMMVENDCGCIPIVASSETKNPIGMITDRDIVVRTVAENRDPLDLQAEDIMTGGIVTVSPETSVEECCNLMESKQIRRIAVVDENGALCGMVAQADIAINASTDKTAEVVQEVSKTAAN
ncbi:MAG TPA: CBS domain-containing protein [Pyrinomonadaceae bacterium]|jgi:CBS domain-containing protein|nr:CBS domain-containing protein [Pyrinomonadaceae bacterium]